MFLNLFPILKQSRLNKLIDLGLISLIIIGLSFSIPVAANNLPEDLPTPQELTTPKKLIQGARLLNIRDINGDKGDVKAKGKKPQSRHTPQHKLVTPGGKVFHSTDNEISNLRTVQVPGSSTQLYLWNEKSPRGHDQAFYAISRNGKDIKGRVRATTYNIRMRGHRFDPLKSVPPVKSCMAARSNNDLYLVQFVTTPLKEFRSGIKALGGKVHRFMTDHTYIVEMSPETKSKVASLPYVRWIGPYHPSYRLERCLQDSFNGQVEPLETQRYSIMVCERGVSRQNNLSRKIRQMGGQVHFVTPDGFRMEATLTHDQLLEIAHANEVQYIDRWGGPGEEDMDIVRQVGGADHIEGLEGWTGQGVRGEIFDTGLLTTHQEWSTDPIIHNPNNVISWHGTNSYSINFAHGIDTVARGMLPDATGIFFYHKDSTQFGGSIPRSTINQELIDPNGPYRAVFQTSSVGSFCTTEYNTISAEVDDYLFQYQILSLQSQSNAGTQMSRPQAWAKNIVSIGAIYHYGTTDRSDDRWAGGASIGPAADGRIKPDLTYFCDGIHTATSTNDSAYREFGGTSAATPTTAGHFGILFQMWHEQVWAGHGGKATVFDSRPHMITAKALMINQAYRYDWDSEDPNRDITRYVQGWGTADVQKLYDRANVTSIIDESEVINPLETKTYIVRVVPDQSELNITMAYTDPPGNPNASQARINDLSLRVTSPGGVIYWGNHGLDTDNHSIPGGSSNTVDTVENVFIQSPDAGLWTVEIIADELVQDAHLETPELDADFALVVSGGDILEDYNLAPLPEYQYTYTYSSHTRGFWFTAPTDFTITGLQVPNEQDHGLQNVEVVLFDPGVTPQTINLPTNEFTSLHRSVGVSQGEIIEVDIPVYAGNVIGILGACGDSSIMHNSYGEGNDYTSEIFGYSVTLKRLGMQYNLTTSPAQDLWTNDHNIGRVKMFYGPLEAPIPPFSYTYSSSTKTRGYWFTAPTDFAIKGLQVPDEKGHGLQNIEVVLFDPGVTPPIYDSNTNAFTSLYRDVGNCSNQILEITIPVYEGEVIGILGACGDPFIMYNSYGSTPYTSEIFGLPVTFARLGMQYNLATSPARELYTSDHYLGRVKMVYGAINESPLPGFSYTYSYSLHTRGYWFTAPTDFTIIGLQVPDETAHGLQNIEVVRFAPGVTPQMYNSYTNDFTSLHRSVGVSSGNIIRVSIPVSEGDIIGILGACGDSSIMHNSYGTAPFISEILGEPVEFRRLGMQYNLSTNTAQNLWTSNGMIGRVKLFYAE